MKGRRIDGNLIAMPQSISHRKSEAEKLLREAAEFEVNGKTRAAIQKYTLASELTPESTYPHIKLGDLYYENREYSKAKKFYLTALEINPNLGTAHFGLAAAYECLGELDKAVSHYQNVLAVLPTDANSHYNLAGIYERTEKPALAIKHYKLFIRYNGKIDEFTQKAKEEITQLQYRVTSPRQIAKPRLVIIPKNQYND